MYINKKSPIPAYYQLKRIILGKIENGEYSSGNPIPSERDLSETLNISRMTVRQALNELVAEGVLYREKGKGTFVSKTKIHQRNIMSFSDTVRKRGLVPSTKILYFAKEKVNKDIVKVLDIQENEMVYNIKRLRLANDEPIGIEEVYIPEKYCPNLEGHDLTASLYKLIRDEYSQVISYVDNTMEASRPSKEEKDLLNIASGIPVLRNTGVSYSETDSKLLYEKTVYRSDKYVFDVRIFVNKNM